MQSADRTRGITYLSEVDAFLPFEDLYLHVRSKEERILDDSIVKQLPYVTKKMSVHSNEWKARTRSFERMKKYFLSLQRPLNVMDLGCGNGWTAARLAEIDSLNVSAVDVNRTELEQGARVFQHANLRFFFGNIFEEIFPAASFDVILLNACAQYFKDLRGLIDRLFFFLKDHGEIHIIDSPFYTRETVESARQRTEAYYRSIGAEEMTAFYHHHTLETLSPYAFEILSRKNFFSRLYASMIGDVPSNFFWRKIVR